MFGQNAPQSDDYYFTQHAAPDIPGDTAGVVMMLGSPSPTLVWPILRMPSFSRPTKTIHAVYDLVNVDHSTGGKPEVTNWGFHNNKSCYHESVSNSMAEGK